MRGFKRGLDILLKNAFGVIILFVLVIASYFVYQFFRAEAGSGDWINIRVNGAGGSINTITSDPDYTITNITNGYKITYDNSTFPITTPTVTVNDTSGYAFDRFVSSRGTTTINTVDAHSASFTATAQDNIVALFKPDIASGASRRSLYYSNNGNQWVKITEPGCTDDGSDSCVKAGEYIMNSSPTGATAQYLGSGNYRFKGWYTSSDGSGNAISTSESFVPDTNSYHCGDTQCTSNWGSTDYDVTYYAIYYQTTKYQVSVNDATMGATNISNQGNCGTGDSTSTQTVYYENGAFDNNIQYNNSPIKACPASGYVFDHWEIDGATYSTSDSIAYNTSGLTEDYATHTLVAVFRDPQYAVTINAGNGTAALNAGQNYTVSDSGTSTITLRSTETNNVTTNAITVTPPSGYIVDTSNPVTTTGSVIYNNNYNANDRTFTLTFNGPGTATINYVVDPRYTVTINAGSGTASVNTAQGYTVADSGTSQVTLAVDGTNITTSTIAVTPPAGYKVDDTNPVTTTGGVVYNNDLNGNTFTLTLNSAGTATVNYVVKPETIYIVSPNNPAYGGTNSVDGWCNPSSGNTTSSSYSVTRNSSGLNITANLVACPNSNVVFDHWELDGATVTQNGTPVGSAMWSGIAQDWPDDEQTHTLVAVFVSPYVVSIVSDDSSKGQLSLGTGTGYTANPSNSATNNISVAATGTVTTDNRLMTIPATGYYLDHFTYDNSKTTITEYSGAGDQWVLTITDADTITAYWSAYADTLYDVSVNIPSAGSIDIQNTDCSTSTNQTFTKSINKVNYYKSTLDTNGHDIIACVDDGNYYFSHWLIDSMNVSRNPVLDDEGYWPKGVTANHHTLQAVFVPKITVDVVSDNSDGSTHGSISITSGTGYTVTQNSNTSSTITTASGRATTTQTVTLTADSGYIFDHFESANGNVAWVRGNTWNEYTLTISGTGNDTVTAFFEPATDVSVDDTTQGYISYWDNDAGQTVNLDNNQPYTASSEVLDGTRYIKGTVGNFWAMPRNGYAFDHWELNGDFVVSPNGGAVESRNIEYQPGENGNNPQLVAFFRDYSLFHVFTGYNDAHGYFDHYLPETQRTNNDGAQAGALQLDGDGLGATTVRSNDTHSTAPNGYYFAYWITGCDSSFLFHEPVETAPGHSDEMNVLGRETIMTTNTYFRPTDEQKSQCSEYVAVWYRVNQQRLIASSENEAIGTVQSHTDTGSSTYGICGRVDQGTSRLMRTIANIGIYNTANGLSIDCYPYAVITNSSYEVDYWTLNGDVLYENGEIYNANQVRKRHYTKSDGSALTIYGNQLNNLVAHFRLKELPHTGSSIILVIIIGGIGAVAIPSVFLILSERKERKKGGKK